MKNTIVELNQNEKNNTVGGISQSMFVTELVKDVIFPLMGLFIGYETIKILSRTHRG